MFRPLKPPFSPGCSPDGDGVHRSRCFFFFCPFRSPLCDAMVMTCNHTRHQLRVVYFHILRYFLALLQTIRKQREDTCQTSSLSFTVLWASGQRERCFRPSWRRNADAAHVSEVWAKARGASGGQVLFLLSHLLFSDVLLYLYSATTRGGGGFLDFLNPHQQIGQNWYTYSISTCYKGRPIGSSVFATFPLGVAVATLRTLW